jgi:tetratricopeptide (TPR) repeat protein
MGHAGFVLERAGRRADAVAALQRSVTLEPDNWRHHLRLASGTWGESRLRAARGALAQSPGLPLAHWLAATVYVARDALDRAERELDDGLAGMTPDSAAAAPFSAVALHWLQGLPLLACGRDAEALDAFHRELALESRRHLYGREIAANTWYAIGALHLRRGDGAAAQAAFDQALARVVRHPMARAGLALVTERAPEAGATETERALAAAASLVAAGDAPGATRLVTTALSAAPAGNAGWYVPVEPLLRVTDDRAAWTPALALLRARAV